MFIVHQRAPSPPDFGLLHGAGHVAAKDRWSRGRDFCVSVNESLHLRRAGQDAVLQNRLRGAAAKGQRATGVASAKHPRPSPRRASLVLTSPLHCASDMGTEARTSRAGGTPGGMP